MAKDTIYTKGFDKAHASINRSFQLALDKTGRVQMGHHILDPRTIAKQSAFDPSTIWNPVGQVGAQTSMDSKTIDHRPFNYKRNPLPKDKGQNPKHAAAGKVVDPTAIETFQGADTTTLDQAGSQGMTSSSLIEGA